LSKEVKTKVIKPPVPKVVSGKIFKPDKAYMHKLWTHQSLLEPSHPQLFGYP
jgi:hypothetical protein